MVIALSVCFFAASSGVLGHQGPTPRANGAYSWVSQKWIEDPKELVEFRKKVFAMFLQDVRPMKEIDALYGPLVEKYKKSRDTTTLAKMLIINSFFLNPHYKYNIDIVNELGKSKGIPCYEFARAAFATIALDLPPITPWEVLPKIQAKWPDDPGMIRGIVRAYSWTNKNPNQPKISAVVGMAEKFEKVYPKQDEIALNTLLIAYTTEHGQTRSVGALKNILKTCHRILAHPQATQSAKSQANSQLAIYEPILKKEEAKLKGKNP